MYLTKLLQQKTSFTLSSKANQNKANEKNVLKYQTEYEVLNSRWNWPAATGRREGLPKINLCLRP